MPGLAGNQVFVQTYLEDLQVIHQDRGWEHDTLARAVYLRELLHFTRSLPPGFEQLHALVLYHMLELEWAAGTVNPAELVEYLGLPGTAATLPGRIGATPRHPDDQRWSGPTGLSWAPEDAALVTGCLELVLAYQDSAASFAPFFDESALQESFIDAKLAEGVGDAGTWLARLADASAAERWNDPQLRFAAGCPPVLRGDDAVALDVELRHVQSLSLRIFSLNAIDIYRQTGAEVAPSIDLSGVVPNHERTLTFTQPAWRRHREHLVLPECAAPGTYLVELIAGRTSLRALLKHGQLRYLVRDARDGQRLRIIDEDGRVVAGAHAWLHDQEFLAEPSGEIRIPYASQDQSQPLILAKGGRTCCSSFSLCREQYVLEGRLMVDREQLIAGASATAILHLELYPGQTVPLSELSGLTLQLTTVNADQVRQVSDLPLPPLHQGEDAVVRFQVPQRLRQLLWTLKATIRLDSQRTDQVLTCNGQEDLHDPDLGTQVTCSYLQATSSGWDLLSLGCNGEAIPGNTLRLACRLHDLEQPYSAMLACDAQGRVHLGELHGVDSLELTANPGAPDQRALGWHLDRMAGPELPSWIHAELGRPIRLPWSMDPKQQQACHLFRVSTRLGLMIYAQDLSPLCTVSGGVNTIAGLGIGRYRLFCEDKAVDITVAAGMPVADLAMPAGPHAAPADAVPAEGRPDRPWENVRIGQQQACTLGSASCGSVVGHVHANGSVTITVLNGVPGLRVHVIGRQFHPFLLAALASGLPEPDNHALPLAESSYSQPEPLGDEELYILARAHAPRLAGVMLDRPGLLLNPWRDDAFNCIGAEGGFGGVFGSRSGGGHRRACGMACGSAAHPIRDPEQNLDFLAAPGVVLANLRPDAHGVLELSAKELGDARELVVMACSDDGTSVTSIPLPERPLPTRDLRLSQALDANSHPIFQRRSTIGLPGALVASVPGQLASRRHADAADLFRLYAALNDAVDLSPYLPLAHWATLTDAERLDFYGRMACHEVNLFLFRKDRPFFDRVVAPYLRNKLQKTFLDHWLLGDDLGIWSEPAHHAMLNVVERCLLLERLAHDQAAEELLSLDQDFAALPQRMSDWNQWLDTAIAVPSELGLAPAGRKPMPGAADAEDGTHAIPEPDTRKAEFALPDRPAEILVERNYAQVTEHDANHWLIPMNRFWHQYAHRDPKARFLTASCLAGPWQPH